ncbi:S41 family peptidase [Aquimarina spongiae]|uniref:Peptidase family S41 n=1 Tax=Aquimarina spongiae TaxID=570521 RepID=A0A1M6G952_9FLAO|nr:S41 family peptidase [Aquimarina spongiae]SHJ06424.1 Peptidase family S41 [Aquimarina spongiae]
MIPKTWFIVFFWISVHTLFAQKQLDPDHVKEDLNIFERILKKGHPSLYDYVSEDSLQFVFEDTKEHLKDSITDIDLFKDMLGITDRIKDGHLFLFPPNTLKSDQYYFPLILKIINTEFYTDTDDFDIPVGSKIIAINNQNITKILEDFKKYPATDGFNLTKKYRDIELKFGLYYIYEYGITRKFEIEYLEPNGAHHTKTVDAESFVKVKLRNTKRQSYFANYHNRENGFDFFDQYIGSKAPFVYYKDDIQLAVLVVNSFGREIQKFKSDLTSIFKEINKKKIKHLVIDIRQNEGGFRPNAIHLFSFITDKPFKQITSEYVTSITIPEKKYVSRRFLDEKPFLTYKFKNHPIYDGWKIDFDDLETIMVPSENRFKGKVYVTTSGTTFSSAAAFALNAKNDPDITVIGEEMGGGYYSHNGEFPVYYELPNSKISFMLFMEKIDNYVIDKTVPKGSGTPPDKYVGITLEDLIEGKDRILDYICRLVRGY